MPGFHGVMVIRDEEDILPQTLAHLLQFLDTLAIYDLGSTDQTWQIVQDAAKRDKRIIAHGSEPVIFEESLRAFLFDRYRDRYRTGDWVLRVDADEFYHIPPPAFVRDRMRPGETCAHLAWYYFRLTTAEVVDYESGRINGLDDRQRPIEQRRRFYKIPDYAEPRMFRYRRSMQWTDSFPFNAGFIARQRIPIRHYPHRDPLQMQKRFALRSKMMQLNAVAGPHWKLSDWRKDVIEVSRDAAGEIIAPSREQTSSGEGLSAAAGHTAGELLEWKPGEDLPEITSTDHLAKGIARIAQRIVHPMLLPLLDRMRPRFPAGYQPRKFSSQVLASMALGNTP